MGLWMRWGQSKKAHLVPLIEITVSLALTHLVFLRHLYTIRLCRFYLKHPS